MIDLPGLGTCTESKLFTPVTDLLPVIRGAGAADLMSHVLACGQPGAALLTGLYNSPGGTAVEERVGQVRRAARTDQQAVPAGGN